MPRSTRHYFPSLDYARIQNFDNEEHELNESEDELDIDSFDRGSIIEESDGDATTEVTPGSDLFHHLTTVSDEVLTFLAASCLQRLTEAGFDRFLSSHNEEFRNEALKIWRNDLSTFNKHFICNSCGREVNSKATCCGEIIKYLRIGAFNQLIDVTRQYLDYIVELRQKLRRGEEKQHNLNGKLFEEVWTSELVNQLNLSLLASIDGVSLNGNTRNKVWPLSLLVIDLPTADMQRASNVILHGVAEGPSNPTTHFWNTVVPMVYADIEENRTRMGKWNVSYTICSWTGDQPAKRSLFGMRSHQSETSCFFGLCSGTFYKTMGLNRAVERAEKLTEEDAKTGKNGFGCIPPKIIEYLYPFDTPLDILHNASGGIFSIVLREIMNSDQKVQPKSSLFENDYRLNAKLCDNVITPPDLNIKNISNCSETLTYFRIHLGLASLANTSLKHEARVCITALMLLLNRMYTNAPSIHDSFYVYLTGAARWTLESSSNTYMSTKAHEFLCHLPAVLEKFGNVAPISTFSYEHYYKFCLKGFSAQKTKGFTESAVTRVLLHGAVRREVQKRSITSSSPTIQRFLSSTPEWRPFQNSWKHQIFQLKQEDDMDEITNFELFATVSLSIGRLQSTYKCLDTKEDTFFALNSQGVHACFRFIAFCVLGNDQKILCERVRQVGPAELFSSLQQAVDELPHPANAYAFNVLNQLRRYDGIVDGKLSGEKDLIDLSAVKGIGAVLHTESSSFYLQVNGGFVHH